MATIHKRRLVSGEIVWELTHGTGKDRKRFAAGKTREQAQDVLNQFNRQLALHGKAPDENSVATVLEHYATYLETNRRRATCARYLRVLQTFHRRFLEPHFPLVERLRQVTPAHIEEYKRRRLQGALSDFVDEAAERREAQLRRQADEHPTARRRQDNAKFGWLGRKRFRPVVAPRTVNYELQVLGTFFRWAVSRNFLFVNPVTNIERLRVPKQAIPKFLTTDQLTRLFAACNDEERRLFMAILMTGMRRGEAQHLTWTDINFDLGVVFIQPKPKWGWKPKSDERIIPMSPALRQLLLDHHVRRRSDELVFPNKEGNFDTHILPKLKKVGHKAGLPNVTVHALRHSFGAHLRMAGVSLADIADLLGHKDLATTTIYAKVHQDHLRAAISKLTSVIEETPRPSQAELPEAPPDQSAPITDRPTTSSLRSFTLRNK